MNNNIYKDVVEALETLDNQAYSDKVRTLTMLIEKYVHKNKADHLMGYRDLHSIIDKAKQKMSTENFPKYLESTSKFNNIRKVEENYNKHICVIESTILHLNKLDCLKRLPKFNYKQDK